MPAGHPHTALSKVGEFGLIDRIRACVDFRVDDASVDEDLLMGISDDAAVYRATPGKLQILTTDAFVEGVHFDLTFTSMKHLGWKSIAAGLSDIAAMGGAPRYVTISLSLPKKISVEMVDELYAGAALVCKKYSCRIVGGDTTASLANMMLSVTVVGEGAPEHVVYRSHARPGDLLCVTGHLGASAAGLKVLQREKKRYAGAPDPSAFEPDLGPYAVALEKHLMPKPRLDLSALICRHASIHAMIDVSDGLASDLHRLCACSGVGAKLYEHNLPLEAVTQRIAGEFQEDVSSYALYGGEEYELLFAATDADMEKIHAVTEDVTVVGRITGPGEGVLLVRENGEPEQLPPGGWDHFRGTAAP